MPVTQRSVLGWAGGPPAAVISARRWRWLLAMLSCGTPVPRPPRVADGSQREKDAPRQEPQVPDPHMPAQRRIVHTARRVDGTREHEGAEQHIKAAVRDQQHAGPGRND